MPGKAAKVRLTEKQQVVLEELSHSRTEAMSAIQRATIVVLAFEGLKNEEIALQVGLNRQQVGVWRQRWRDSWEALCVWECREPRRLKEALLEVLSDAPRPGAPAKVTPEQVGRYLRNASMQPHRAKMWLNTTEKDPEKFQHEVEQVCQTYLEAPVHAATRGTHTISVDEATGLQALERNAADKPSQPGRVARPEFEYTRHGTTTLTAGLDVVTGKIVSPTLEATRTEPEFVAHIARTVELAPADEWVFVVDNLNTHASESLVNWVAEHCDVENDLGKKGFAVSCTPKPRAVSSSRPPSIASASSTSPNTVRGSTKSKSSSASSRKKSCAAAASIR